VFREEEIKAKGTSKSDSELCLNIAQPKNPPDGLQCR